MLMAAALIVQIQAPIDRYHGSIISPHRVRHADPSVSHVDSAGLTANLFSEVGLHKDSGSPNRLNARFPGFR